MQPRPKGTTDRIHKQWIALVAAKMKERGLSRVMLGRMVGVTGQAIGQMLAGRYKGSKLVESVSKALEIDSPAGFLPVDDLQRRFLAAWGEIVQHDRDLLEVIAERAEKTKGKT